MAGAKPGVHVVQLKPNVVPEPLRRGTKALMWCDTFSGGTAVTLWVDEKGTILLWKDMNKEMDFLDIALIRDTRTAKYARVAKDGKLRESLQMGQKQVPLEEKTLSVCWGTDMVNVDWINFVCADRETARLWADELLKYSVNLVSANNSTLAFLDKWYTRIISVLGPDGKIPIKNVVKQIASNREDKKKVEKALESAGLLTGKTQSMDPEKFTFRNFFTFYQQLVGRSEVDHIFAQMGAKKKPYLTVEQFTEFLNQQQRDPRLNEILYPFASLKQAQEIINIHEARRDLAAKEKGHLSLEGFLLFLLSEDNSVIPGEKLDLSEDMTQPLAHYFINSSHNTYLTGHQFTGKSSVEIYRQVLLSGCRCVELDCWDGKGQDEEPMITHGYTMCTDVPFKDVIEAIAESAFKTSDYPVILSFENHCGPKQQAKMANYCRSIFGDMLLDVPLESHPLKPDVPLPSPELLKRKIFVKNKKKHFHKEADKNPKSSPTKSTKVDSPPPVKSSSEDDDGEADIPSPTSPTTTSPTAASPTAVSPTAVSPTGRKNSFTAEGASPTHKVLEKNLSVCSEGEKVEDMEDFYSSDTSSSDDEELPPGVELSEEEKQKRQQVYRDKGTAGEEAEAALEMSALVNYIQPIHFHSFESSEKRKKSYEISSFVETQALALLKESPVDFVNYNKRQLSRIYPRGTRVDSSNFMPQVYWNAGCQLVALNFQTLDLAMQINLGIFEYNGRSGYILKPDFMRRNDRHFDPFTESTVDGIVAGTVTVKVISGQFLSDKRVGTYVEVDMYGLPTDTVRKKFRTKTVPNNGMNPVYDEEPFVFKKVVLPNLAIIRLGVYEETGKLIGHRIMPVEGLRPGYRHVPLRNEANQALMLQTIFVHIIINDYVPDQFAAYADALLNPILYISQLEKHAQQLEILTEDFENEMEDGGDGGASGEGKEVEEKVQRRQNSLSAKAPSSVSTAVDSSPSGPDGKASTTQAAPPGARPTPLNRLPSAQHMPVAKQESAQSMVSQAGTTSGKMLLSEANLQLLLCGSMNKLSTPLGENGTAGTFAQDSKLNDTAILNPTPLEELKSNKIFQKALAKRDKDLESVKRKYEKTREVTEEQHQLQLDKLITAQTKARIALEKSHTKALKKMAKCGESIEDKQQEFKGELQLMLQTQDQEHREVKYKHADVMLAVSRDFYQAELDVHRRHQGPLYEALSEVMAANHGAHGKVLEDIHAQDVGELKKAMDPKIRDHMKELARKHKDKQERARMKREAQQKLVGAVVSERQRLSDLLSKRKEELQIRLDEVRKAAEKDKEEYLERHTQVFHMRCQKLQEQFDQEVQAFSVDEDDAEDPDPPPTPHPPPSSPPPSSPLPSSPPPSSPPPSAPPPPPALSDREDTDPAVLTNGAGSPQGKKSPSPAHDLHDSSPGPEKVNSQEELTPM